MAWLYFADDLDGATVGGSASITGDEAKHAVGVARTRVGETIAIGDGAGTVVRGPVTAADAGRLTIAIAELRVDPAPVPELWIAQALAKGDRDELAVQAATELGVSGVVPWAAERSVSRWDGPKAEKGRARWAAIVREASKQSIRSRVPAVEPVATTRRLATLPGIVAVLDPTGDVPISALTLPADGRLTLVVGPEGGVSPRELDELGQAGAVRVRLGDEVLRTSTAGPAALAVLNARLGRW